MINELKNQGAELCEDRIRMVLGAKSHVYSADKIYHPKPKEDHCLHESLDLRWWLLQLFPQQYYDKEDGQIQWRVPYGVARTIPAGSLIHGSAVRRMQSTATGETPYRPRNLKLEQLRELEGPVAGTTADLGGCYVYDPGKAEFAATDSNAIRMAKLLGGWISFGVLWALMLAIAWCVVSVIGIVVLFVMSLIGREVGAVLAHLDR